MTPSQVAELLGCECQCHPDASAAACSCCPDSGHWADTCEGQAKTVGGHMRCTATKCAEPGNGERQ